MAIDEDEIHHLFDLRDATKKRMRELRVQKTLYGIDAPAHIAIEIKQAEKDLALLEAKLQTVQPSADVVQAVGPVDTQTLLLDYRLKQTNERMESGFREVLGQMKQIADQVIRNETIVDQRHGQELTIRTQRQEEHDARMTTIEQGLDTNALAVTQLFRRISVVRWLIIGLIVAAVVATATSRIVGAYTVTTWLIIAALAGGACIVVAVLLATKDKHPK